MKKILTMLLLFGLMTPTVFAAEVGQNSDDVDCTKIFEGTENKSSGDSSDSSDPASQTTKQD